MVDSKEITFGDERRMDGEFGRKVLKKFVHHLVRRKSLVDGSEETARFPLYSFAQLSTGFIETKSEDFGGGNSTLFVKMKFEISTVKRSVRVFAFRKRRVRSPRLLFVQPISTFFEYVDSLRI
jgi:hypothetical protein